MDPFGYDYDTSYEDPRHRRYRPKCDALNRKGEHRDVHSTVYNTAGALLGTHFRCRVCNCIWNQYANDGDFPDPHNANTY